MTEKKKKKQHVRVFEAGKSRAKIQEGTTAHTRSPEKGGTYHAQDSSHKVKSHQDRMGVVRRFRGRGVVEGVGRVLQPIQAFSLYHLR